MQTGSYRPPCRVITAISFDAFWGQLQLMVPRAHTGRACRKACCPRTLQSPLPGSLLETGTPQHTVLVKANIVTAFAPRIWPLRRLFRRYDGTGIRSSTWSHPAVLDALLGVVLYEICNPRAARPEHRWPRLHFSTVGITLFKAMS
jgi:hypothetical protein